jgi:hypothetical protein
MSGVLSFEFAGTIRYAKRDSELLVTRKEWALTQVSAAVAGVCRVARWCPWGDSNTRHAV